MRSFELGGSILVTGAAGKTGRAVVRELARNGARVRAFAFRPRHRAVLEELGAEAVVEGDLRDPERVAAAMRGVDAIYHICPNVHPDEVAIGRTVIGAARRAAVKRFVFHSVLHPQIEAMPHHWSKMRVEELLFASGLDFTILQPAPYMQNVLGQWRSIAEDGVYSVPYGLSTRLAMVDLEDVATAAARVLTEPGHAGATYELCGPDLLDQQQVASALAEALGREVRPVAVPHETWARSAADSGMDRYPLETLLAMFRYYDRHGMAGSPRVLESLLSRPPTSFSQLTRRLASTPTPTT